MKRVPGGGGVGAKPLTTPTKDSAMDIGDIEMDVSARSHSQKERADKADVSPCSDPSPP